MHKFSLTEGQMSSVEYVERAAWWSRELTRFRARGPGDIENAMRSIEKDYAIEYWTIWRLRYRLSQCKDIGVSIYARIEAAYYAECERQQRKLATQLDSSHPAISPAVVAKTEALVGRPKSPPPTPKVHAQRVGEESND